MRSVLDIAKFFSSRFQKNCGTARTGRDVVDPEEQLSHIEEQMTQLEVQVSRLVAQKREEEERSRSRRARETERAIERASDRQFEILKHMSTVSAAGLAAVVAFYDALEISAISLMIIVIFFLISLGTSVVGLFLMLSPIIEDSMQGNKWLGILTGVSLGAFVVGVANLLAPVLWLYYTSLFS